jgi:hypothetical protein
MSINLEPICEDCAKKDARITELESQADDVDKNTEELVMQIRDLAEDRRLLQEKLAEVDKMTAPDNFATWIDKFFKMREELAELKKRNTELIKGHNMNVRPENQIKE